MRAKGLSMSRSWLPEIRVVLLASAVLALSTVRMPGQAITGTLVGTVRDATGAVISAANVTATNTDTNIAQSTVSGSGGDYTIPNLPPGRYKVTAQIAGF